MPLSTRRLLRRRAPATQSATAQAAATKLRTRTNAPSEAMAASLPRARCWRAGFGFVLRRALRDHAVGRHREAVRAQCPLQHNLRIILERVRDDAGVSGGDHVPIALDLELILQRLLV